MVTLTGFKTLSAFIFIIEGLAFGICQKKQYLCKEKTTKMAKKQKSLELLQPILVKTFGLERVHKPTSLLADWLATTGELNQADQDLLQEAQEKLIENADIWNEEELKMHFLSFVIFLARFNKPICTYYEREIASMVGGVYMTCKTDMMLAKGIGELIEAPYFFLHEYKREKKYSGDPIGQMLGGMLIAQAQNNNGKPIYGCYVQGRFWFFSILESKQYVISKAFDASEKEEALQIVFILRKLKQIILERLMD